MSRKQQVQKPLAYVVWSYPDHGIVADSVFDTRKEAQEFVEEGLRSTDIPSAEDVVICELVPRCYPKTEIVAWRELPA